MVKSFLKLLSVCAVVLSFLACSSANNKPVLIGFNADSTAIVFNQIDQRGLLQLQQLPQGDTALSALFSVLQTPSEKDTTFKESPVQGKIKLSDSNLVFIPALPFVKGRDYLVITHLNARFGDMKALLRGELKPRIKPYQQVLTR
jgi:hypothetical protein